MTNVQILKIQRSRIKDLSTALQDIKNRLNQLPEGTLRVVSRKENITYYQAKGESLLYLGSSDKLLLKQLEEKGYLTELKKAVERQIKGLRKSEAILENLKDPEAVFLEIAKTRTHLIDPYEILIPSENGLFRKKIKQKNPPASNRLITEEGELVRSKSELIIANKLHSAGVPYHYELPTAMGELDYYKVRPDFTVLNKRTGEVFFWEHLGMMDNPEYSVSAQIKLENYIDCGIQPGKNLLITMESSKQQLDTKIVDKYIQWYLL